MKLLQQVWKKLLANGYKPGLDDIQAKNIEYFNILFGITFLAYVLFDILLFDLQILSLPIFIISSAFMFLGFAAVYYLTSKHKILVAKNLALFLVFVGVFFYNISIGKWAGVHLYYFAFFSASVNLFYSKKERPWLILHLLLPAVLISATEVYNLYTNTNIHVGVGLSTFIYVFNFCMTLLIISFSALALIKENIAVQLSFKSAKLNVQSLIDNTQGYIWSIDMNFKLIAFSNTYKEIIKKHYSIDCYEGLDVKTILELPNNPQGIRDIYKAVLKGESLGAEYFSNNNYFEIQASPLLNADGKQTGATFHSRLINARKIREQELQQSKINLETLIDTVGNSTWSLTKEYKIIAANKMYIADMKRIFGIDIMPGYDVSELFKLPNYPAGWQEQYETVFGGQNLFLDYTFEEEYFELNGVPTRNINNDIVGAVFFSRNITERKMIEQELTKAKTDAEEATIAKAQFLSNMSHELRTPLNGIIGLTNILISESYLPSQTNHLEVLKYSSDHMLVLINDILDFNKIEAGKVVLENNAFNLLETLQKMYSFFSWEASSKGLEFEIKISDDVNRMVKGDVTRLRQVLTNLISNAIKFTEKGKVIFAVEIVEKIGEKKCRMRFSIADTGIGIASDKLEQIFESFGQADPSTIRKYGGSGLGLTISKKLTALMGTTLQVESKIGAGSRFWFDLTFECLTTMQILPLQKNINEIKGFDAMHILVVEDNAVNMMVVSKMLLKWNATVSKASNGLEAVELAAKHQYDVILMDLQMPIMDGLTATSHIRKTNNTTPIIALTATTDESLTNSLSQKGINDVVQKPFVPEDLYNKIISATRAN
jgi:signal transduction histidine kinase/CheY-like chemotaxis protein